MGGLDEIVLVPLLKGPTTPPVAPNEGEGFVEPVGVGELPDSLPA